MEAGHCPIPAWMVQQCHLYQPQQVRCQASVSLSVISAEFDPFVVVVIILWKREHFAYLAWVQKETHTHAQRQTHRLMNRDTTTFSSFRFSSWSWNQHDGRRRD